MSYQKYSFSVFCRFMSLALVATGCGASGAVSNSGTGGDSASVGGKTSTSGGGATSVTSDVGGNAPSVGGGGVNPLGGSSSKATGGTPATGGNATGGAPCVPGTQIGASMSTNYGIVAYPQFSPFYVFNNGWSTSTTALTNPGTQQNITAYDTCTPGTISWSTTYNWAGDTSSVRAYPAAILGWHSTKGFRVDSSLTGLPKAISALTSVKCSWDFSPSSAAQNVSFDLWVHSASSCTAAAISATTVPSDEIMIWLYSSGGVNPIGYNGSGTDVSASGASWKLYNGSAAGSAVHSFVRQGTTTSVTDLDILALLKTSSLGLSSKCLISIEAGTEIYNGSGTFKTNSYKCTVQ